MYVKVNISAPIYYNNNNNYYKAIKNVKTNK